MSHKNVRPWLISSCAVVAIAAACDNGTTSAPIPALEASTVDGGMYHLVDAGVDAGDSGARDGSADTGSHADATTPHVDSGVDAGQTAHDASGGDASKADAAVADAHVADSHVADTAAPVDAHTVATDAQSDASPGCAAYAAPDTTSTCTCPSGSTCTPNGCTGGKYCHTTTNRCVLASSVACDGGT